MVSLESGVVIKSVGSRYKVLVGAGLVLECTIRGKLRVKDLPTTNPVAVGDHVQVVPDLDGKTGIITEVLDRKNYILRRSSNLSKQSQILASNIDQLSSCLKHLLSLLTGSWLRPKPTEPLH